MLETLQSLAIVCIFVGMAIGWRVFEDRRRG
jgi:hypothetical protein